MYGDAIRIRFPQDDSVEFVGYIKYIKQDTISFSMPPEFATLLQQRELCHIRFTYNRQRFRYMHKALELCAKTASWSRISDRVNPIPTQLPKKAESTHLLL